jgi:hypothetical protein
MNAELLSHYLEKPCKFKLKSGKEIYGVVWKDGALQEPEICFSSKGTFEKLKASVTKQLPGNEIVRVSADEIVAAEYLMAS